MPHDVYLYDRLVIDVGGTVNREPGTEADRLRILLSVKNPVGSLDATLRLPNMEVWDTGGRVFEIRNDDWAEPILPDTEVRRPIEFEVAPDADGLQLVLAPGEPEEVRIPLPQAA